MLIRLLRTYLGRYRWVLVAVAALQFVQTIATLYLPSLNADIIDNGIATGDTAYIWRTGLLMLGVTVVQVGFAIGAVYYGSRASMGFGRDVRDSLFHQVTGFSTREVNEFGAPSLITRITNDVQQVQMLVFLTCTLLIAAPITAIGGVIMAIREDGGLSMLLLISIPALLLCIGLVISRMVPQFRVMQERIDGVNRVLREQITGVRVVRAFVREPEETARFDGANADLTETSLRAGRLMAFMFPTVTIILNLSSVAALWLGANRIDAGDLTVGALIAFLSYLTQILIAVMMATFMAVLIPRAAVCAERIQEVLRTDSSVRPAATPITVVREHSGVELRDVSFAYPGAEEAVLSGISLHARPGQTTAIVGSTGAGKTTLINLVPRLFDATAGAVLVDGVDVRELAPEALWSRVGLVPQKPYLFSGTVASNLRYGKPDATEEEMWEALEIAQARAFVAAMPGGLEAPISQGGTNVSGGQRQRLAIARAVVRRPEIYLFDDSFSALDLATDARLRAALAPHTAGAAVLVVAQRISTIVHADQILVLEDGLTVGLGTHAELLATCSTYAEIVSSQLGDREAGVSTNGSPNGKAVDPAKNGNSDANGTTEVVRPPASELRGGFASGRMSSVGVPAEKALDMSGSVKRLLRLMAPDGLRLTGVISLAVVSVVLLVLGPKILGHATDLIVSGMQGDGIDFPALHRTLLTAAGLYATSAGLAWLQAYTLAGVVQRTMYRLRNDVEGKLNRLPLSYIDRQHRGDLLSRVTNDIDNIAQSLQQTLSQLLTSLLTIVGVLVMMITISPLLALVAVVSVPLSLFTLKVIAKRAQPRFVAQWRHTGMLNAQVEEAFTGHSLVKAFGRQREVEARFAATNEELYQASFGAQFVSGIIQPAMMFIGNLNFVAIAVVGGLRVSAGAMTIGDIQAFIQYSRQFTQPLTQVASMANVLQSGIASAERIFELLDAPEQTPDAEPAATVADPRGRVAFEHVSFSYDKTRPLIQDLSLVAEPGSTVAIVGPTGAGKTTLVNLIMRFYELDSGRITLDGEDIAQLRRRDLRSSIGMVLQDTWLFGGTVRDNIAYGNPAATEEQILEAARATYVDRFVHSLPHGYDTHVDDEGSALSAGEKQLITIARAFLADPAILILDEATSSVDTRTEVLIQEAMAALRSQRTSFVIAHRLSTIRDADTILVMDGGQIVEQGSHEELLAAGGAYATLYNAQFAGAAVDLV